MSPLDYLVMSIGWSTIGGIVGYSVAKAGVTIEDVIHHWKGRGNASSDH